MDIKKIKVRSLKGTLLSGVSEMLPASVLVHNILQKEIKNWLNNKAGVYALYKKERLYYIGLSKNLYTRLLKHQKDKHRGEWNNFKIFRVKNQKYIKDIETMLLIVNKPLGNTISGLVPKKADINRNLLKVYNEHMRGDRVLYNRLRKRVSKRKTAR